MPKVYILPEIVIWDKKISTYCHPDVFAKKQFQRVDWREAYKENHFSHQEYILYLDGVEIPRKDNRMMSPLTESYLYYGKVNNWGLFSFDITPGEHTLRIDARQESYYKEEHLFPFTKNGETCQRIHIVDNGGSLLSPYKQTIARYKDEIKFNVGSSNVYFRYYLEYEQHYPLCHEKRYFYVGSLNNCRHNDLNCWFYYDYLKYARNQKMSFDQISYATLKCYMDERFKDFSAIVYNEPMPEPSEEELAEMNVVKSSTGNGLSPIKGNASNAKANSTRSVTPSTNGSGTTLSIAEQAKAQGKTIAQFIMDRPEPANPRKRIVKKEVEKHIKYYDTDNFKQLMQDFSYSVVDKEVILEKVIYQKNEIIIPDGVTIIKENAFGEYLDKTQFVKLPYSVKILEKGAFKNNKNIEKVEILSRIEAIENETFFGCSNLKEIKISSYAKKIKSKAFLGTKLKKVYLSDKVKVNEDAFEKDVEIVYGTQKQIDIEKQVYDAIVEESLIDKNNKDKLIELKKNFEIEQENLKKDFEEFKGQLLLNSSKNNEDKSSTSNKFIELEREIEELKVKIKSIKEKV